MKRRMLSILLALSMVLSLLPTAVLAEEADEAPVVAEEAEAEEEVLPLEGEDQIFPGGDATGAEEEPVAREEMEPKPAEEADTSYEAALEEAEPVEEETAPEEPVVLSAYNRVAYPVDGGNIYFDPTSGTVVDCDTTVTKADIPNSINGVAVTEIGKDAFDGCNVLASVIVPDGVTQIVEYAFDKCNALSSAVISNGVTWIGEYAFRDCSSLTNVTIPNSLTYIGAYSFERCPISHLQLTGEGEMTSEISNVWRYNQSASLSVEIGNGITTICSYAFGGCTWLTSMIIPDSVTSIGYEAFRNCNGLTSVTIPGSVASIEKNAFQNCGALASVAILNGVSNIGENAFQNCSNLTDVVFPDSVASIGTSAFQNCIRLSSVTLPGNIANIGAGTFGSCERLTSIRIPDSVTSIGKEAFNDCRSLTSIVFSDRLTTIDEDAFYGCMNLMGAAFPDSLTRIGASAFYGCESLTRISVPNVSLMGNCAFCNCINISDITISGQIDFGIYAYPFKGCTSISHIKIVGQGDLSTNVSRICGDSESNAIVVDIESGITSIGRGAFDSCNSLTSVTIPNSVASIGARAFYNCGSLTSVPIPDSVISIGESAFYGCSSLTGMFIPDSVTSIGNSAFYGCSSLTSVTLSNDVTSIGASTFYNCSNLTSVTIPSNVTSIGGLAFYGSGLTSVTISDGVTSIGREAFGSCNSLTSVSIPYSVTSIDDYAFSGCSSLTDVYYSGSETDWRAIKIGSWNNNYLTSATIHYNYGAPIPDSEKLNWAGTDPQYTLAVGEEITLTVSQGDGSALDENRLVWRLDPALGTVEIVEQKQNYVKLRGVYPGQATLTVTFAPGAGEDIQNRPTVSQIITVLGTDGIRFETTAPYYEVSANEPLRIHATIAGLSEQEAYNVTWATDDTGNARVEKDEIPVVYTETGLTHVYARLIGFVRGQTNVTLTTPDGRSARYLVVVSNSRSTPQVVTPPKASGQIEDVFWYLKNSGLLEIRGSGAIPDFDSELVTPWAQFRNEIKTINIYPEISSIGKNAFRRCTELTQVTIPKTVTSISENAFFKDNKLEKANFGGNYPTDWNRLMENTAPGNEPLKNLNRDHQIKPYIDQSTPTIDTSYQSERHQKTDVEKALESFASLKADLKKYTLYAKDVTTKEQAEHLQELEDWADKDKINKRRIEGVKAGTLWSSLSAYESSTLSKIHNKELRKKLLDAICLGFADKFDEAIATRFKLAGKIDLKRGKIFGTELDIGMDLITAQIIGAVGDYFDDLLKKKKLFDVTVEENGVNYYIEALKSDAGFCSIKITADNDNSLLGEDELVGDILVDTNAEGLMRQYTDELCGATVDVLEQGLKAYWDYLDDLTGIPSSFKDQSEEDISKHIGAFFEIFKLRDKAQIVQNSPIVIEISAEVDKLVKKAGGLKFKDLENAAENLKRIGDLTLDGVQDQLAEKAIESVNKHLKDYCDTIMLGPDKPEEADEESTETWEKKLVEAFKEKYPTESGLAKVFFNVIGVRCPVDFRIYDQSDNRCIGYVEGKDIWYDDQLLILVNGDCKDIYIPGEMEVRFEFTGTDTGEMNYVLEEVRDGITVGRRNYYHIPLADGATYTQEFSTGTELSNLQSNPVVSSDGSSIFAAEYLDAWDETKESSVYVDCVAEGGGTIIGAGNFPKGDAVTLYATPDSGQEFIGWFVNGVLVSAANPYQFAALESQEVHGVFRVPYQESKRFDTSMGTGYRNMVASVYEDDEGASHIELYQMGAGDVDPSMTVQVKLYRADHTLYSEETVTADYDLKNSYWLPTVDLDDCAKAELYDLSGNMIADLRSAKWSDVLLTMLECQQLQIGNNRASCTAAIHNPNTGDVTGTLISVAYSGGKQIGCTVIPSVTVTAGAETEKQVSVGWQENLSNVTVKLFFLDDSWAPLAPAVTGS